MCGKTGVCNLNIFQMGKKSLEQVIRENQQLGFDKAVIEIAYANVGGDSERVIEEIFRLQQQSQGFPTKPASAHDEDAQLSKAIELSMNEAKDKKISLEPLNPEQRLRKSGVPVGLKNIGNTCYFNSLLQTYFQNVALVREVLAYEMPLRYRNVKDEDIQRLTQEDFQFKRKLSSCRLVDNLKTLFVTLIASDKKYADPTPVLSALVDDYGNQLAIGDQKDIGEFNLVFLSRIQDGLQQGRREREGKKKEAMEEESVSEVKVVGREGESGSLLRRSSLRLHGRSVIGEQFIGKIENSFSNEKEQISKTEEELFSLLFVNVKHRDLYKALEEATVSQIEDYRNDKGEVIGVEKHSWIKEAPKTLFFQIDRVVYDKATLAPHKVNDSFDFPTTFYIDPFLHRNRHHALSLQKSVRSLRHNKDRLLAAIQAIERPGGREVSLPDLLGQTRRFLASQVEGMDVEGELENPTALPDLNPLITTQMLTLLQQYREGLEARVAVLKGKVAQVEREIEEAYRDINKTPYQLYSLLIHEGSADSGHYYSYTYDHSAKRWRKYNDITITEEAQENVLKEGKGVNAASAYYLVYSQKGESQEGALPHLTYKTSAEEGYLCDLYSSFLSPEQRAQAVADNHQLHLDIEQFKMSGFASRVVDVYAKKFQTFNEIFRKSKNEKKKNTPPLLTSLPVYARSIDEDEYRSILIEQAITQYGPKEPSPVFEDILRKKLANFNDFKRPKKLSSSGKLVETFTRSYYCAIATRRLFQSIQQEQYQCVLGLLRELLATEQSDYFNWLARLLTKVFVVRFLAEAERDIKSNPLRAIERLQLAVLLLLKLVNREEERMLTINTIFWMNQIMLQASEGRQRIEELLALVDNGPYQGQLQALEERTGDPFKEITASVDLADALWNTSRQENTVIDGMLDERERVKGMLESYNKLYVEMKKINYPLKREEREKIMKH